MDIEKLKQLKAEDLVEVGETYHFHISSLGEIRKVHIVAIVEGMIVYRWFGKHKQWWHYFIEGPITVSGHLERAQRKPVR